MCNVVSSVQQRLTGMAVFSDTIRYVNCMAEKYPGVLWNIKHCKFVHCSNSITDTLAMQWYTLSDYWCTGTEAGTHTAELRLCALLAIRAGCKERQRWSCWSKIYSDRQKLHKGKSVAARTGSW